MKINFSFRSLLAFSLIIIFSGCYSTVMIPPEPSYGNLSLELEKVKVSKKEKQAWEKAKAINSINSYKDFIKAYPNGKVATHAQNIITRAQERYDELSYLSNDPNNFDLTTLFDHPYEPFMDVTITVLSYDGKGDDIILENVFVTLTNPKGKKEKVKLNEKNKVVLSLHKYSLYDLLIEQEYCEDVKEYLHPIKDGSPSYYIFPIPLKPRDPVLNPNDGKYYDPKTGELFTGKFEGKEIVDGVIEEEPKVGSGNNSSAEDILWSQIISIFNRAEKEKRMQAYLEKYPNGKYAVAAQDFIDEGKYSLSNSNNSVDKEDNVYIPPNIHEVVTDPLVTAAPDTVVTESLLSEECLEDIENKGVLAYNSLSSMMKVDSTYTLEILINDIDNLKKVQDAIEKQTGEKLDNDELVQQGSTSVKDRIIEIIRVGSWMRVTLDEPEGQNAFRLNNNIESDDENSRGQNIDCDMNAHWEWDIIPIVGGKQTLFLNFYLKNNEDAPFKLLTKERKIINVEVIEPWYAKFLLPVGATLGMLTLLFFWIRNKKKKQSEDYVFGANLGIAGGMQDIATPPAKPKNVFIAYAKEDEEWTKQIYNQMKVLNKGGYVNIWYDQMIEAGAEYKEEIFKHLEQSDIIMLNISSDFLACDFCDELMQKAMDRQTRGEGVVLIPIIVRPCLWATTPLAKMNVFPQNKKPLTDDEWSNADNAIVNVMNEVEGQLIN